MTTALSLSYDGLKTALSFPPDDLNQLCNSTKPILQQPAAGGLSCVVAHLIFATTLLAEGSLFVQAMLVCEGSFGLLSSIDVRLGVKV